MKQIQFEEWKRRKKIRSTTLLKETILSPLLLLAQGRRYFNILEILALS